MNKSMIALFLACYLAPGFAADDTSSFTALFEQAQFWQEKNRNDLAKDALQRILNADPQNKEAIYRMGMIAAREGDEEATQQWTNLLAQIAPADPRVKQLGAAKAVQAVDPATLAEARRLSSQGQYDAAIKRYQEVFGGVTPTLELSAEYYLTLAGTKSGIAEAKAQLNKLSQGASLNSSLRQAYAQVLSYDENTRRQGIELLSAMAATSPQSDSHWRQALLWLDASASDKKYYDQYMSVHPNDLEVINYFQSTLQRKKNNAVTNNRSRGYQALNANKLKDAERLFKAAVAENAKDADAAAGLGLIRLKQQQFDEAKSYLAKAMALSPAKSKQWTEAYQSADFYAQMTQARRLMEQEQYERALNQVLPLTTTKTPRSFEAQILAAQLEHKQGKAEQALQRYNAVLQKDPSHLDAKLGLIAVLQSQGRWSDAERLAALLPEKDRNRVAYVSQAEVNKLRADAANTNDLLAEISLRRAMKLAPADPWVRLDLARLIARQGDDIRARTIVEPLQAASQSAESRYAAAMFASEQKRWLDVDRIMSSIPQSQRTPAMNALAAQSAARSKFSAVIQRASVGDQAGARQLLIDLHQSSALGAKVVGELANELVQANQTELAYQLVELDLMQGLDEKAGDYIGHISVMNESGRSRQARELMTELMLRPDLTEENRRSLMGLQQGLAVREADQLRNSGQLALAYDLLAARLREAPENEELLLAMGRLYESGNKTTEADEIYNYVLKLNPANQQALSGAVNLALAQNDTDKAAQLLSRIDWNSAADPELLVMAARVSQAKGDDNEAAALLLKARKLAYQDASVWGSHTSSGASANPFREPAETASNPFRDKRLSKKQKPATTDIRPSWLPGQAISESQDSLTAASTSTDLFEQIDSTLR